MPTLRASCGTCGLATALAVPFLGWLLVGPKLPYRDGIEEICEHAAFFKDNQAAFLHTTDAKVRAFVEVCREAFGSLEPEAQRLLWELRNTSSLVPALAAYTLPPSPPPDFETCTAAWDQRGLDELDTAQADLWRAEFPQVLPLRERTLPLADVAAALKRAEVARFDARELLPARMFNVTLKDVAAFDPAPGETEIFETPRGDRDRSKYHTILLLITELLPRWGLNTLLAMLVRRVGVPLLTRFLREPSLALSAVVDWDLDAEVPHDTVKGESWDTIVAYWMRRKDNLMLSSANINARRLAGFADGVEVARRLGLADDVEYTLNMLWFGATPGSWHIDIEDNVLVQLTETAEVFILATNCSVTPPLGPDENRLFEWLRNASATLPKLPFFHVTLRPGQGVAIPGNTFHKVLSRSGRRVGINYFFEPKFGRMSWPAAPRQLYKFIPPAHLAMRSLWLKSITSLWTKRKIRMAMHTRRMEFV